MSQNPDEWIEPTTCDDCGAEICPDRDTSFVASPDAALCAECAERRGGVYDARQDRWTTMPDLTGISDERRAHP